MASPVVGDFGSRGKLVVIGSGCAFPVGTNCSGQGNGKWVRVYPTKKGTFDCKASNAVEIKENLIQQ